MTLLLNVNSGRALREWDEIRPLTGHRSGGLAKVVGFDLLSEDPVLVQYSDGLNETQAANDLEFVREGPGRLEPLPPIVQILQEGGADGSYRTCASMLCLRLHETSTTLTLIPKKQSCTLREVLESALSESATFGEAVVAILSEAYITRLPHLVEIGRSKMVESLLGDPERLAEALGIPLGGKQ